jgi:PleD family two-component response regulator
VCRPVRVAGGVVEVDASIGIDLAGPGDSPDTMLERADEAMYRAKGRRGVEDVVDLRTAPAAAPPMS